MIKKHGQGFLESFVSNNINWWYSYTGWMMDVWGNWTYGTIAFLICVSRYVIWDPAFERKKGLRGLTNQPSEQLFKNSTWLTNIIHVFFYIQSATPPAPSRHRRVWEKGLRGLPDSPSKDRNKRASSGAVRLQSPISSSVCGRRTRCKHLLSSDWER